MSVLVEKKKILFTETETDYDQVPQNFCSRYGRRLSYDHDDVLKGAQCNYLHSPAKFPGNEECVSTSHHI